MVDISTSLLSVKKEKIIDTVYKLEDANTNYFHIDVMDGEFVENDTHDLMLEYCEYLDNITKIPLDIHLMVKDVKNFVDSYLIFNPNIITFHYEACKNKEEVMNLINYIKEKGRRVGISVKPETDVKEILEFLPYVHVVLVMTVEPGKGGQELILPTIEKIKELNSYREEHKLDYEIEADGGIKVENSKKIIDAGADILVAGTAIINSKDYAETIKKLILELESPIFMTSANQSGEPTCTSLDEIEKMCPNLDGMMEGNVIFSKGSTIIDCSDDEIKILREGPITIEQINEIKKICF